MADECHICLTELDAPTSLPCGHALYHPCVRELVFAVQQSAGDVEERPPVVPLCRAEHKVHNNDVDAAFGASAEKSTSSRPASARVVARGGLRTLTVSSCAPSPPRSASRRRTPTAPTLRRRCSRRSASTLPRRCARCPSARSGPSSRCEIPCDDLLEAPEHSDRVAASARGLL